MIWLAVDAQELPRCVEPVDLWIMFSLAGVEMHSTVALYVSVRFYDSANSQATTIFGRKF